MKEINIQEVINEIEFLKGKYQQNNYALENKQNWWNFSQTYKKADSNKSSGLKKLHNISNATKIGKEYRHWYEKRFI